MTPLANHLYQSTLFAIAAWGLTLALRDNRAAVRYWVWFAASVKFLLPFSMLVGLGSRFEWRTAPVIAATQFPAAMSEIGQPFAAPTTIPIAVPLPPSHLSTILPIACSIVWLCGILIGLIYWARTLLQIRGIRRNATPVQLGLPIPALVSPERIEPGIFGVIHPVLILPDGIAGRLAPAQLDAVLAHELAHARRRDNLTAAVHMVVETVFWFHPLLWWIRMRLVAERERACDEAVLAGATDPHTYAEAILSVCKLYLESPLVCVSGVTGANLKHRIETIVANRNVAALSGAKKLLLALATAAVVAAPVAVGVQVDARPAAFEVASIKPAAIPIGREGGNRSRVEYTPNSLTMLNVDLSECVQWAYGVRPFQIADAHASPESYDILAKSASAVPVSELKLMLQDLLAKRFQLTLHRESRMLPVYQLVVAKGGPKLPPPNAESSLHAAESLPRVQGGSFVFDDASLPEFAAKLSQLRGIDLPVVDRTGIKGTFDLVLKSAATAARDADGAALFAIVQEQLGLKLESAKAPFDVMVIDHAPKPSSNFQTEAVPALAQTPTSFEAASIKPLKNAEGPFHFTVLPNRLDVKNMSLGYLILQAYDLPDFKLSAPDSVFDHHFDIIATSGAPVSGPEMRIMLQNLLRERFHLATHWEDRTESVFRLVALPSGPRMKKVDQGYALPNSPLRDGNTMQLNGPMSMRQLAERLTRFAGKPVLDETKLEGYFIIALSFAPDDVDASKEGVIPPLFPKAIEEQLGLKLVAATEAVKIMVVDHADTAPVEN